jgi:hypothetical protein
MDKGIICKVEETRHLKKKKPVIEAINEIFSPN